MILWKCSKNPQRQNAVVAVVVGLWIVWAGTLFVAVHTIHSLSRRSLLTLRASTLDARQGWHVADRRMTPLGIIVPHSLIHNRDQLGEALGFQEQRVSLGLEASVERLHPLRVLVAGSGLSLAPRRAYEIRSLSFKSNCDVHS